jgi:hypothetical protein
MSRAFAYPQKTRTLSPRNHVAHHGLSTAYPPAVNYVGLIISPA